jgi:type II secretory ATPase GspE/PulE/Tfp pilus assembly ATPase PilB-like protein
LVLIFRGVPALGCWLVLEQFAAAAPAFPRGPGFYYHPFKLVCLLLLYFCWLAACGWVERDVKRLGTGSWAPGVILLGAGSLGLVVIWLLPFFWLSLSIFLVMFAGTTLLYMGQRDQRVDPADRVLTEEHLRSLLSRYLRFGWAYKEVPKTQDVPVRFLGRNDCQTGNDNSAIDKLRTSKGYKGALELVHEAVQKRATDIHLEPARTEMAVRLRIDGLLTAVKPFTRPMGDAVINVIKVLCSMDITERRKPQDGSFTAQVQDQLIDFRVATAGSVIGEKMAMRILDKTQQIADLAQLGMRDKMREQVRDVVTRPHGLFLVCGPTGAGKTTTLYACLNEIDRFQHNVITLENPVEYQLANVTQIEMNAKAGKTFASELRSILRQDPDLIMIGEIRDQETAVIACQAAQTGHMVFSTLHASDTVTALGRLIDLGVPPALLADALSAVLGQRLVRQLCPACKVRYKPNPELLRKANLPVDKIKFFYRPPAADDDEDNEAGNSEICATCGGAGYFKRTGIFEWLVITDKIRELIRDEPNLNTIRREAVMAGMRHLYEDGLRKVLEGDTSIQELLRVS